MSEDKFEVAERVLHSINLNRGNLWEKISLFHEKILSIGGIEHECGQPQEEELKKVAPIKQHIEGGFYTRELFMPKGGVIVSMIHKQQHPSFLLKGDVSYLLDNGEVNRITAPHTIFTQIGTQRVFVVHEDSVFVDVYKTDAKTFEEAESDVYTMDYKEIINLVKKEKWQELHH